MNILEKINRKRILFKARNLNKQGNINDFKKPLILCQMGLGNIANMKNIIEHYPKAILVVDKEVNKIFCEALFNNKTVFAKDLKDCNYDPLVICNWLNQRKYQINQIIKLKIPNRIGHVTPSGKWNDFFNYQIPITMNEDEIDFNTKLIKKW